MAGKNISVDEKAIPLIVKSLSQLLSIERKFLNSSAKISDDDANSMMSDFIAEQEKQFG